MDISCNSDLFLSCESADDLSTDASFGSTDSGLGDQLHNIFRTLHKNLNVCHINA